MSTDIHNTTIPSTNTRNSTTVTTECNICLEAVDTSHATITHCGHFYHKNCLCSWFNSKLHSPPTCPTCRADLKYERGVVKYYSEHGDIHQLRRVKLIQNTDGDYFFYPSSKIKYFLEIDRKTNLITGGFVMNKDNTERKEITPEIIETQYEKLEQQRNDDDYDLWEELVSI